LLLVLVLLEELVVAVEAVVNQTLAAQAMVAQDVYLFTTNS
jgi:hypothetical protein